MEAQNPADQIVSETVEAAGSEKPFIIELKKQLRMAGPLTLESTLLTAVQLITMIFVGHLDALAISSAALSMSLLVCCFSFLMGLSQSLETYCGQSYGAGQFNMVGVYTQRAMVVLCVTCVPLAILLANAKTVFMIIHQEPTISYAAGMYARFLIPSLFAFALLQCLLRFLRTQNNVFPIVVSAAFTTMFHIFISWLFVKKFGLGNKGAAIALSTSYSINLLLLGLYVKLSPSCINTWTGFSKNAFRDLIPFIKLAFPSAIMVCSDAWAFHLIIFLGGLLPNPQLRTSVLSISHNLTVLIWMIPMGLSSTISIRISNELGAGNTNAARLGVYVVSALTIVQGILLGAGLFSLRNVWGRAYNNDSEILQHLAALTPILVVTCLLDGFQCVLSGIARGCGQQKFGAIANFISFILIGIPLSIVFAFVLHINEKGLRLGIVIGLLFQTISLIGIIVFTDWEKQAEKAIQRGNNENRQT